MRIYLTGEIVLEAGGRVVGEDALPGLQGRVVLAMLAAEHRRRLARDELADELWGERWPPAWEAGLRALVSKIRAAVAPVAPSAQPLIGATFGCYQFHLPGDGTIDVEVAHAAVHDAEAALRRGDADAAGSAALVTSMISRRAFLVGADGPWVQAQRERLLDQRVRALEVLARVWASKGDYGQAARDAQAAVALDPYRETAYQLLMRAHAAAGNMARAVAVYQACRQVLAADLGVNPSPATEAAYRTLLMADPAGGQWLR